MKQQTKTIENVLNSGFCIYAINYNIQTEIATFNFIKKVTDEKVVYTFKMNKNNVSFLNKFKRTIIK